MGEISHRCFVVTITITIILYSLLLLFYFIITVFIIISSSSINVDISGYMGMQLGMELGMKLFLWSVALLPPSASFKVLLKKHCKDSHLTPIDKSVVKMAFNRVLLCCIQNVNNTLGLYLGGGWKQLAVPRHVPPLPITAAF